LNCYLPQSKGFLQFLHEASDAWHNAGLLVSLALHPHQKLPNAQQYELVDRIHLMAYDMSTGGGLHHAEMENMQDAASVLVKSGCPKSKIVVGIPGYARHLRKPEVVKTFAEVYDGVFGKLPADVHGHNKRFFYSKRVHQGLSWDSPLMVEQKVQYVKSNSLGGVFLWELGHDKQIIDVAPGGILLEVASQAMRGVSNRTNNPRQEEHRNRSFSDDEEGDEL
jgi:GH18 family chitinase